MSTPNTITIDSVKYVRENGRIKLSRALHVFKWVDVGFAGIIENMKKADLRKIADVDIPEDAEIFCVPVSAEWGL